MDRHTIDLPLWNDQEAFQILEDLCKKHRVPVDVFRELVGEQRRNLDRGRARGIYDRYDEIFNNMD